MKLFSRFSTFLSLLAFVTASLAGGASYYKPYTAGSAHNPSYAIQTQSLPFFNKVAVSGNVDVTLNSAPQNAIIFLDDPSSLYVSYQVKNNTLIIRRSFIPKKNPFTQVKPASARPQVQINVAQLNKLDTSGQVKVQGQINSQALVVNTKGASEVYLTGMMNLQQANAYDSSLLKIYWVNSPNLIVNGHNTSTIKLAGVTQVLHARLNNNAQLNAPYLRAQQGVIQTDDNAYVGIVATNALRGFASEDSNIFYYKYPKNFTEFSIESGNILQVDWRE